MKNLEKDIENTLRGLQKLFSTMKMFRCSEGMSLLDCVEVLERENQDLRVAFAKAIGCMTSAAQDIRDGNTDHAVETLNRGLVGERTREEIGNV